MSLPADIADDLKRFARQLGFDLVGITRATPSDHAEAFRDWLSDGRHGTMKWLEQRVDERLDPTVYLPGAKSVLCVAINYRPPVPVHLNSEGRGRIARYALGDDYHDVLRPKLFALADRIRQFAPDAITKCGVDTAPILEREFAARAGIGWIGKHTLVLNEKIGSWIFLGEVVTTLELPPDAPATDHCGTCRRCIDACPTTAITRPYQLDARRCISYLTIENRSEEIAGGVGNWLFGCDICQEVCPFNSKAPAGHEPAFASRFEDGSLNIDDLLTWEPTDYQSALRHSAMKRVKLPLLKRNAMAVADNAIGLATDVASPIASNFNT